jgi:hypothetical protein
MYDPKYYSGLDPWSEERIQTTGEILLWTLDEIIRATYISSF